MSLKFTFNPFTATFDSIQNLSGLNNRVLTLENNEYKIVYFTTIGTASGTITIPQGATILLDQFPNGVDAYVSQVDANGQPTGILPKTGLGVDVVVTSFDALGNYTLSDTPSSFPVALIYVLKIKAIDYNNLAVNNILEDERIDDEDKLLTWSSSRSFTQGQKFIWQSPHGDYRTYIVRSGQTLNAGETPFTHPKKVEQISGNKVEEIAGVRGFQSGTNDEWVFDVNPNNGSICGGHMVTTTISIQVKNSFGHYSSEIITGGWGNPACITYIESLNEFWVLLSTGSTGHIYRIDGTTNTVISPFIPLADYSQTTSPTVFTSLLDGKNTNFAYVVARDATNWHIYQIDKTTRLGTKRWTRAGANTGQGIFYDGYIYIGVNNAGHFTIVDTNSPSLTVPTTITDTTNLTPIEGTMCAYDNILLIPTTSSPAAAYDITNRLNPTFIKTVGNSRRNHCFSDYNVDKDEIYLIHRPFTSNNVMYNLAVIDGTSLETKYTISDGGLGGIPLNTNNAYKKIRLNLVDKRFYYPLSTTIASSGVLKIWNY